MTFPIPSYCFSVRTDSVESTTIRSPQHDGGSELSKSFVPGRLVARQSPDGNDVPDLGQDEIDAPRVDPSPGGGLPGANGTTLGSAIRGNPNEFRLAFASKTDLSGTRP